MSASDPDRDVALNPRQREMLERLGAKAADRPVFPDDLGPRLRADLESEIAPLADDLPEGETLFVSKHALTAVHSCEARWHGDARDPTFTPSPPVVQGSVAHKAIELTLNRSSPSSPAELVDRALDRLTDSDAWMADYLRDCGDDDRAEIRSAAVARVSAFVDLWPPLDRRWSPVTEARLRAELAGGRVVLSGRTDLSLGRPVGGRAGRVIVDFKTGATSIHHRDDLRYYALIETLRVGVPPRAVATSYLDSGALHVEDVTEASLEAAAARAADGVARMVAILHHGEVAARRPSGACRWCSELPDCAEGRAHLDTDREHAREL